MKSATSCWDWWWLFNFSREMQRTFFPFLYSMLSNANVKQHQVYGIKVRRHVQLKFHFIFECVYAEEEEKKTCTFFAVNRSTQVAQHCSGHYPKRTSHARLVNLPRRRKKTLRKDISASTKCLMPDICRSSLWNVIYAIYDIVVAAQVSSGEWVWRLIGICRIYWKRNIFP